MTDAALVARLQRQDPAAYDALVARFGDALYSYLFLSTYEHRRTEAQLSAALLCVVEQIERYNAAEYRLIVWLYRIAHTVTRHMHTVSGLPKPAPDAPARVVEAWPLYEALTKLPLEERQLVMLRTAAGPTLHEVGYVLGMSSCTARRLQFQALRALQELAIQPLEKSANR